MNILPFLITQVGGLTLAVLLDCDEGYMRKKLQERAASNPRFDDNHAAIMNRLKLYKHNTLPVLAHYDDLGKLHVVSLTCIVTL